MQNYTRRYSGKHGSFKYNVKAWVDGAWEWASGVNADGSGKFGADAQRHMVVEAMQQELRATKVFAQKQQTT